MLRATAIVWFICAPIAAAAQEQQQPVPADRRVATIEHVRERMAEQVEAYAAQSFKLAAPPLFGRASRRQPARAVARLAAGTHYAIVATCDSDCRFVAVSLLDAGGRVLMRGPEQQDLVIVNGVPESSGLYEIEIGVPDCAERVCHVGLSLMRDDVTDAGETPLVLTTGSQRRAGALVTAVAIEARPAHRLDGDGFLSRTTQSYAQCELHCSLDARCRAASFHRTSLVCRLHEQASIPIADPDEHAGLKRQEQTR